MLKPQECVDFVSSYLPCTVLPDSTVPIKLKESRIIEIKISTILECIRSEITFVMRLNTTFPEWSKNDILEKNTTHSKSFTCFCSGGVKQADHQDGQPYLQPVRQDLCEEDQPQAPHDAAPRREAVEVQHLRMEICAKVQSEEAFR